MDKIKKIRRMIGYFAELIKYILLYPVAMLIYGKRRIYIFAERGVDARDNGYHLYRYFKKEHPELEAYYVISKDSADKGRIEELGGMVRYRSLKHYLVFIAAEYKISTHIMGYSPSVDFYIRLADKLRLRGHRIFLQHGIISNDHPALYSDRTHLSLFICGAKPEYDYINERFGYKNGEVQYTGLARYDGLYGIIPKKRVLCMPTWRKYLKYGKEGITEQSEYVKKWNALINHPQLLSALEKNGMELVFYPHHELQEHISLFHSECERVIIADEKHYGVQELLKESMILVTDFSSVFYDFAYMRKPVVYYQFDKEKYYSEHYARGYFSYEEMGFGKVTENEDEAAREILGYIENGAVSEWEYASRVDEFFPIRNRENCRRIFEEIEKL